jgi:hypothetical protein
MIRCLGWKQNGKKKKEENRCTGELSRSLAISRSHTITTSMLGLVRVRKIVVSAEVLMMIFSQEEKKEKE